MGQSFPRVQIGIFKLNKDNRVDENLTKRKKITKRIDKIALYKSKIQNYNTSNRKKEVLS
jgi:hypothetical protein